MALRFPEQCPANDYDGDGITDPAIYYPSMGKCYILASGGDYWELQFGFPGTTPVPADYSGDLKADIAVYYPPSGLWYIWTWTGDYWEIPFGWNETLPAPGDYDGSGKADMAVYYPLRLVVYLESTAITASSSSDSTKPRLRPPIMTATE